MNASSGRPEPVSLTALLLAGGPSNRFGSDKAEVLIDGEPLWARQLDLLRRLEPQAVWLSARLVPPWAPPDAPVVLDIPPSRGPLSGIAAALERMNTTHLLALAVDLPKMTIVHLQELSAHIESGRGIIPLNGEYFEPLAAIYPKEAAGLAQQSLASTDLALHSFARTLINQNLLQMYRLSAEQAGLYLNLNSPADLPHDV